MATLYRKYRPQNFSEVVNQNHVKITLQNEIQTGKITHAYLFCGPRAVGKTTIARVFSKAVNCEKRREGEFEPCNKCASCTNIFEGKNMDVIEIDAASHTGVDNVRENIIASARVAPSSSKYKVFIIDEVHMLSASAFNALLKTMEEPPAHAIFILCTTEVHKVPTTIISRCQRFDFKRIGVSEIVKKLSDITKSEGIKIDKKILEDIARNSEGHMRDAESLLGQVISIGGKEVTREEADLVIPRSDINEIINLIEALVKKDASGGVKIINNLVDTGVDLKTFVTDFIEILRKILISRINPSLSEKLGLELGENLEIRLNEISKNLDLEKIILFINKISLAREALKSSFIIQLPLELAIAELCLLQVPSNPSNDIQSNIANKNAPNHQSNLSAPSFSTNKSLNINKDDVLSKWSEVLVKIKKYNHSLSFILRACEPREINGNQICLVFKYKFHKDRVTNPEIKVLIEKVLAEVFGNNLTIEALVDESLEIANGNENSNISEEAPTVENKEESATNNEEKPDNPMIDNLLKTFGGKVIK